MVFGTGGPRKVLKLLHLFHYYCFSSTLLLIHMKLITTNSPGSKFQLELVENTKIQAIAKTKHSDLLMLSAIDIL